MQTRSTVSEEQRRRIETKQVFFPNAESEMRTHMRPVHLEVIAESAVRKWGWKAEKER